MKKLFMLVALMFGLASCQNEPEDLNVVVGGEQDVMLTVSLPESTRGASSAGFDFTEFDKNGKYDLRFILEISYNGKVVREVKTTKTTSATFPVRLAPEKEYTFTVWADLVNENSQDDLYYNILTNAQNGVSALSNITFKEWTPNVEARDAYTLSKKITFNAAADLTMKLERPFAKVRVVATDIKDVTKFDIVPTGAKVEYTSELYTSFDAVSGVVAGNAGKINAITYPIVKDAYEDEDGQLTVFADYIFVPANGTVQFKLDVNAASGLIKSNNFNTAIPVVANKVTSIVGDVLTHGGNVSITVNNGIGQHETINMVDTADDLQEVINNTAEGESANITLGGDIDLNDLLRAGTLSTRAGETAGLVIPANKTVVIDLKGYTISYSTDTWNKHMIENYGNLTLKGEGSVAFTFTGDADTTHGKGNYAIVNNGTLTIEGATVSAKASKVAEGEKFSHALYTIQMSKGAMTLESGSIINYNGYAVRQFGASDITVNGGMVKGTRALWIQLPGSDANVAPEVNVTVNGGTLIGTGETGYKLAIYAYSYGNDMANVNIAVNAGTIEGDIALTGGNNKTHIETLTITGGTLSDVYSYGDEKAAADAITITGGTFSNITPLAYLNTANEVVTLNSDVVNAAPVKFAGEGTLNLNGHNVTAVDTTEVGYGLITNNGNLTITGEGKMTLSATIDSGWNRYSSVISNGPNGNLTVNKDVTIEHNGGTSMAYGIDVLTNGGIGDSHATVYGTVKSKYRAIRQFLNSDVKMNTLIVKEGATVESTGGNKAIWMQDPSKKANTGKLVVESGAKVHSVYLDVTKGSTEWPVEVSVAASSLTDQSENKGIYTDNIPAGYAVVNENGIWTVSYTCAAKIGEKEYKSLKDAFEAVKDGETITLARDITFDENSRQSSGGTWYEGLYYIGNKSFTIDLNGKTITQNGAVNDYLFLLKNDTNTANTINFKNGTLDAGTTALCALCTSTTSTAKITINLENVNLIGNNSKGAVAKIRGGAELNVKAGTKITGKDSYLGIENWNATVNVYEGAEIYMNGKTSYNGCLIGVGGNGVINVYGGYGKGVSGGLIAMTSGGTINVSGGEWIANTDGTYANSNKSVLIAQSEKGAKSVINVTGGTFKGGYNCYGDKAGDAQINIKGGNFNANPASYVAKGYEAVEENGVWTITYDPYYDYAKVATAEALQAAINNAVEGENKIRFTADIVGDVEIIQKNNVKILIDGANKSFTGIMATKGYGADTNVALKIANINFIAKEGADACILSPDRNSTNPAKYSNSQNVTVENCTFTDPDGVIGCAAVRHSDGGDTNWTLNGCSVDNTMHSILQVNNVLGKLTLNNCTVNSKNGANFNSCTNVEMSGCNFDVLGYAVRIGVKSGGDLAASKNFTIANCTLKSACNDGDPIIEIRQSAVNATIDLRSSTLNGTTEISGATDATTIIR